MIDDIYSQAEQERVKYYLESANLPFDIATVNSVIYVSDMIGTSTLDIVTQMAHIINAYGSQTENQRTEKPLKQISCMISLPAKKQRCSAITQQ